MKHAEVIIEEMGLGDCSKVLDAPIENLKPEDLEEEADGEKDRDLDDKSDEDDEDEDAEKGKRKQEKMQDPKKPSREEVEEHEKVHLPYRSWCRHCVRGRCKNTAHKKQENTEIGPELHMDFAFVGKENEPGKTATILVAKERKTKMTMAAVVPSKSTGNFIAARLMAFLKEIGLELGDMVIKTDQEPAMGAMVGELGRRRAAEGGGAFVVEQSPVGESQSNGVVERGIQAVAGQTRVLLDALETRWGVQIPTNHPIIPWIVEYSALTLNRFEVGHDGRTAFERCNGKRAKMMGIELGEAVFWRRKKEGGALAKFIVHLGRWRLFGSPRQIRRDGRSRW